MIGSVERKRNGYTLVEMVGVIALTAVLMNLSIGLLYTLNQWGRQSQRDLQQSADHHRFETALRAELAETVAAQTDGPLLALTTASGRSEWRLENGVCYMQDTAANPPRFDRYQVGSYESWQVVEKPTLWRVSLAAARKSQSATLRVVARKTISQESNE